MKNNWKKVKLGDFAEINPSISLKKDELYSFIPMEDVFSDKKRYVVSNKQKRYSGGGAKFKEGDILFARITPCLQNGKISQVKNLKSKYGFGSTEFIVLRSRKGVSDPVFLYYLSISDIVKIPAERSMSGATGRQRAEHKVVQNIELKVPKLQTQQKIASVLSAYDDLIENNNRRIKILEEMAQVIYNEWFVKFRFPGSPYAKATEDKYEKVKIKNGIPEELEEKEILDIEYFNFCRSKVSKYEGKREYFATANIDGINVIKEGELVLFKEKPSRAQIQPKINSVWFARMKDSYKVLAYREINKDLADKHILSSGMIGFEAKEDYFGFLYFTINSEWFHNLKDQYATGATQVSLTNEGLAKMKILAPNKEIVKEYSKGVNIFIDEILNLQRVNNNLRKTRDLLLPKLMSGGIEI